MLVLTETRLRDIVKTMYKNIKTKTKKRSSVMNRKVKTNALVAGKVIVLAGLVASSMYLGVPNLTLEDVVSLFCLSLGFALAIKFVSK